MYSITVKIKDKLYWINDKFQITNKISESHIFPNYDQAKIVSEYWSNKGLVQIQEHNANAFLRLNSELNGILKLDPKRLQWERFEFYPNGDNVNIVIVDEFSNEIFALKNLTYLETMVLILNFVEKKTLINL